MKKKIIGVKHVSSDIGCARIKDSRFKHQSALSRSVNTTIFFLPNKEFIAKHVVEYPREERYYTTQ